MHLVLVCFTGDVIPIVSDRLSYLSFNLLRDSS